MPRLVMIAPTALRKQRLAPTSVGIVGTAKPPSTAPTQRQRQLAVERLAGRTAAVAQYLGGVCIKCKSPGFSDGTCMKPTCAFYTRRRRGKLGRSGAQERSAAAAKAAEPAAAWARALADAHTSAIDAQVDLVARTGMTVTAAWDAVRTLEPIEAEPAATPVAATQDPNPMTPRRLKAANVKAPNTQRRLAPTKVGIVGRTRQRRNRGVCNKCGTPGFKNKCCANSNCGKGSRTTSVQHKWDPWGVTRRQDAAPESIRDCGVPAWRLESASASAACSTWTPVAAAWNVVRNTHPIGVRPTFSVARAVVPIQSAKARPACHAEGSAKRMKTLTESLKRARASANNLSKMAANSRNRVIDLTEDGTDADVRPPRRPVRPLSSFPRCC